jgi:hypothetical protein
VVEVGVGDVGARVLVRCGRREGAARHVEVEVEEEKRKRRRQMGGG